MPVARMTDPETSHEAARSLKAEKLNETQNAIMQILDGNDLTDEEIAQRHFAGAEAGFWLHASESGLRSRRAELVQGGLVQKVGKSQTRFGRAALVWGKVWE